MDIDGYLDELLDPIKKIYKVFQFTKFPISLDDVFNVLGDPAKSLRVRDKPLWDLEDRKRAISMIVLDLGTNSKY